MKTAGCYYFGRRCFFLQYLPGERAPIWNANAGGVYFGVNIEREKAYFVRATIEGILYELYRIPKTLSNKL